MREQNLKKDNLLLNLMLILVCLVPIIGSFFIKTDGQTVAFRFHDGFYEVRMPCVFKTVTGYKCPSCGGTRSFAFMGKLSLVSAWNSNKATAMLYVFMALQIPYRLILIVRGKVPFQKIISRLGIVALILVGVIAIVQFAAQFI
jgi:hypothetical protein